VSSRPLPACVRDVQHYPTDGPPPPVFFSCAVVASGDLGLTQPRRLPPTSSASRRYRGPAIAAGLSPVTPRRSSTAPPATLAGLLPGPDRHGDDRLAQRCAPSRRWALLFVFRVTGGVLPGRLNHDDSPRPERRQVMLVPPRGPAGWRRWQVPTTASFDPPVSRQGSGTPQAPRSAVAALPPSSPELVAHRRRRPQIGQAGGISQPFQDPSDR
jgi:hypothetical protein